MVNWVSGIPVYRLRDRAAKHSAEHNAAGKVMKNVLRQQATEEWEKRKKMCGEAKAKL